MNAHKFKCFIFSALSLLAIFVSSARATEAETIAKLEKEEATWHRFALFRIPNKLMAKEDMQASLEWFKGRVIFSKNIDSRYPAMYSYMLWQIGWEKARDTSLAFAMASYVAMQVDAARCANQAEAHRVTLQWMNVIGPQLRAFQNLPVVKRKILGEFAIDYVSGLPSEIPADRRVGPLWICHILPSYTARIALESSAAFDRVVEDGVTVVFISHPEIAPELATKSEFESRRESILQVVREKFSGQ